MRDKSAKAIKAEIAALPHAIVPTMRAVRKAWTRKLAGATAADVMAAARALNGEPRLRWIAYELVRFHPGAFASLRAADIEAFAGGLDSWSSVDAFGCTLAGIAWQRRQIPDRLVARWARSHDRWLRRLALVATVPLNARESRKGDAARTLGVCRTLVSDRDDMVVKALSWALRALSVRDREAVVAFLKDQDAVLAPRVKREVGNKLTTGLKTPRGQRALTAP